MRIDYSLKFPSFHDAEKEANRIREKVKREAERKGYAVQMLIGISDMDGKTKEKKQPHLHIMFYACPCETLMATIIQYINVFQMKHNLKSVAKRYACDVGYIPYIVNQSRKTRHFEHDPDGILKDFNIRKAVDRIESGSFRKSPYPIERDTLYSKASDVNIQLPCNKINKTTESRLKMRPSVIERINNLLSRKRTATPQT